MDYYVVDNRRAGYSDVYSAKQLGERQEISSPGVITGPFTKEEAEKRSASSNLMYRKEEAEAEEIQRFMRNPYAK